MQSKLRFWQIIFIVSSFFFVSAHLGAKAPAEIKKEFSGIDRIKISTISGDCFVKKGDSKTIAVIMNHTYGAESGFVPVMEKHGSLLVLKEEFEGRSSNGSSIWNLSIPDGIDLKFSTASGEFEITGLKVELDANSASGDMELSDVQGELDINTASGQIDGQNIRGDHVALNTASGRIKLKDVEADLKASAASGEISALNLMGNIRLSVASGDIDIDGCKGELKASAASGDIVIIGFTLTDESSVSAASGDVEVKLAASPEYDLSLSAASGDCQLDFNGNDINGTFDLTARANRNRISAPFQFDREEIHKRWGDTEMVTKTAKVGKGTPYISISSASGKVEVRK
ncbi:DUF4097 family beta strand repeat protein [candidate division KSB1 bacterium]|nr:DUF4097 family beta strand repeat protein [candidate division KSB1 bacterium]